MLAEGIRNGFRYKDMEFFSGEYFPLFEAYTNLISCLSERAIKGERHDEFFRHYGRTLSEAALYFSEAIKARYLLSSLFNYPLPLSAQDLLLGRNETLLEYAITEKATYIFVVDSKGVRILKADIKESELKDIVSQLEKWIESFKAGGLFEVTAKRAYDLLLSEALKDIPPDQYIIVVPDSFLGLFPFEALAMEYQKGMKDPLFVADKWTLSYSPSASFLTLIRIKPSIKPSHPLFALGDPVFKTDNSGYKGEGNPQSKKTHDNDKDKECRNAYLSLSRLPWTKKEVLGIAEIMGITPRPPHVLLGANASETNLKKVDLARYRYIHFATHGDTGFCNKEEPLLFLGLKGNKQGDDGLLTFEEIMNMKLNADLVTLSAGSTGDGKIARGEGVLSLGYAFLLAGAKSVVVAHNCPDSQLAAEFMISYYDYLKKGNAKANAIKMARKKMKEKFKTPFYWASFVLWGDNGNPVTLKPLMLLNVKTR